MAHCLNAGFAQILEVIAGERVEFGGECGTTHVAELFGVQLDGQAERACRLEDAARLRRREGDAFAEGVDRVDQPLGV